jgi:hypothetical protein
MLSHVLTHLHLCYPGDGNCARNIKSFSLTICLIEAWAQAYSSTMSEERKSEPLERYSSKVFRYSKENTWKFSKQQFFVDALVAILITVIGYKAGIVTSVGSTVITIVCGYLIAFVITFAINLLRALAAIHQEMETKLVQLGQQAPITGTRQIPAPASRPEARPNIV